MAEERIASETGLPLTVFAIDAEGCVRAVSTPAGTDRARVFGNAR